MAKTKSGLRGRKTEKRKSQRLKVPVKVRYKLLPKKKILNEIFCYDLSGGGLRLRFGMKGEQIKIFCQDISGKRFHLRLSYPLQKEDRLKTLMHFPADEKPVAVTSRVVWCRKLRSNGKQYYDVGIKHSKFSKKDRERFIFLFCEMMLSYCLIELKRKNRR